MVQKKVFNEEKKFEIWLKIFIWRNPDIEIGTDWKSLTLPASLPITTDYFPDGHTLQSEYAEAEHTVLIDDSVKESWRSEDGLAVLDELIFQRLQQGFQFVTLPSKIWPLDRFWIVSNFRPFGPIPEVEKVSILFDCFETPENFSWDLGTFLKILKIFLEFRKFWWKS